MAKEGSAWGTQGGNNKNEQQSSVDTDSIQDAVDLTKEFNNLINQGKFGNEAINKSLQKQLGNWSGIVNHSLDLFKNQKMGEDQLKDILTLTKKLSVGTADLANLTAMRAKHLADAADLEKEGLKNAAQHQRELAKIIGLEIQRVKTLERSVTIQKRLNNLVEAMRKSWAMMKSVILSPFGILTGVLFVIKRTIGFIFGILKSIAKFIISGIGWGLGQSIMKGCLPAL